MEKVSKLRRAAAAVGTGLATVAGGAMAQTAGDIDVTSVTTMIAGGLAAVGLIGAAWVGLKYLSKIWHKV